MPQVAGHREGETDGGKQDRLQAQRLVDLALKHGLVQQVDKVTHGEEVLDLVWTNNLDLISDIETSDWPSFTDHKLVKNRVSFRLSQNEVTKEEVHLCETGKRFSLINFSKAKWTDIQLCLKSINWTDMKSLSESDPEKALEMFNVKLLEVLEENIPAKVRKVGKKSRPKMDKRRNTI